MKNIKISFLEREFFAEDRTGTTLKGYEPAIIKIEQETKFGRVIDTKRLGEAQYIDTKLFQTLLPLSDSEIDLTSVLEKDENGSKWLESHKKYFAETYKKNVPMILFIKYLELPKNLIYIIYPTDIERITLNYECPKGVVDSLPNTAVYYKITPPMKFEDGKWIPNIYYKRNIIGSNKNFISYSMIDPKKDKYLNVEGILLGTLKQKDLKDKVGDFERCFPLKNF